MKKSPLLERFVKPSTSIKGDEVIIYLLTLYLFTTGGKGKKIKSWISQIKFVQR